MKNLKQVNDDEEFLGWIQSAGDDVVVVDFYTTFCGPCKEMEPFIKSLCMKYPKVLFLKVNAQECDGTSNLHDVRSVPFFVIYMNKTAVDTVTGANPEELHIKISMYERFRAQDRYNLGSFGQGQGCALALPNRNPTNNVNISPRRDFRANESFNSNQANSANRSPGLNQYQSMMRSPGGSGGGYNTTGSDSLEGYFNQNNSRDGNGPVGSQRPAFVRTLTFSEEAQNGSSPSSASSSAASPSAASASAASASAASASAASASASSASSASSSNAGNDSIILGPQVEKFCKLLKDLVGKQVAESVAILITPSIAEYMNEFLRDATLNRAMQIEGIIYKIVNIAIPELVATCVVLLMEKAGNKSDSQSSGRRSCQCRPFYYDKRNLLAPYLGMNSNDPSSIGGGGIPKAGNTSDSQSSGSRSCQCRPFYYDKRNLLSPYLDPRMNSNDQS